MKYIYILVLFFYTLHGSEIAIAKKVVGEVSVKKLKENIKISDGSLLDSGMIIFTKADSSVTIIFKDNSKLILGSNAILNLEKYSFEPQKNNYEFELFLKEGSLSFESGKISDLSPEDFILKTPDGTVSIRGTKFFVKVQ